MIIGLGIGVGFGSGPGGPPPAPPENSVAPVVSGTARVGQTLTSTTGTWTGDETITYAYQWRRDGGNIGGATNSTYVITLADLDADIDCAVTATNDVGSATANSNDIAIAADLSASLASAVFDLDATVSDSYPGTGTTWANLVTAPADGSAQAAYEFTTQGLTFNGLAGSAAAYLSTAGAGQAQPTSGNTSFLNNLPKTTGGTSFWFAMTFRFAGAGIQRLFNGGDGFSNSGSIGVYIDAAEDIISAQRGDTGSANIDADVLLVDGTDYIVIVSHDTANNLVTFWINTITGVGDTQTYNATTTDAGLFSLFAETDLGLPMQTGSRIYSVAMGNEYLDNTKAAAIIAHLEARHGRDYTP